MNKSENVNELATALSKAQAQMTGVTKDATNPFFKSRYSTLDACWDAIRKPLTENGLSIVQTSDPDPDMVTIETILLHSSGQWISGVMKGRPVKTDPQGIGSATTYFRRYGLMAITGLSPEDDDAESAMIHTVAPSRTAELSKKVASAKADDTKSKAIKQLYFLCCNADQLGMSKEQIAPFMKQILGRDDINSIGDVSVEELNNVIAEAKKLVEEKKK